MDFVSQFVKNMGVVKLSALGIAGLCVSAFLLYFANFSSTGDLGLLFGNIDPADGARIVEKLESLNVTYDIRGDGRQIYVPRDKVSRLRMEMAQEGLPNSGAVGYEIFDRQDVLGSFSTLMDINSVRALEGELSKSIQSIGNIAAARVHLVVPKRELFSRDKNQPSASVVLKMKGVARLLPQQVRAIQHLVAFQSSLPSYR